MHDLPRKDYYGVLQLPHGSSIAVVRQRYKRLAKRLHPDVNPRPDAASRFREINEAYEVLTDPSTKALVDGWYAETPRPARSTRWSSRSTPPPPAQEPRPRSGPVPFPARRADRTVQDEVAIGCLPPLVFCAVFAGGLASRDGSLFQALLTAVVAAYVIGLLIRYGGEKLRELLLWWTRWW